MGIMGVIIGLIIGVIGLVIVTEIIEDANFTQYGTLVETVTDNIPILYRDAASATLEGNCGWAARPCGFVGRNALAWLVIETERPARVKHRTGRNNPCGCSYAV